jgi:hypothetical protein
MLALNLPIRSRISRKGGCGTATVNIAILKERPLHVAVLIEVEKWMIAGAPEVAVVGRAFLIVVGWAGIVVHVQNDLVHRLSSLNPAYSCACYVHH